MQTISHTFQAGSLESIKTFGDISEGALWKGAPYKLTNARPLFE